jgi:phosphoenolpyruvate carboxykinase (diphosphate)
VQVESSHIYNKHCEIIMTTQNRVLDFGLNTSHTDPSHRIKLQEFLNFKLATHGISAESKTIAEANTMTASIIENFRQKNCLLEDYLPPVDQRIQSFLDAYLIQTVPQGEIARLPGNTFVLNQYGLARELSLPPDEHEFHTDIVHSYRIKQGVLHNPKHDRRTTKGVFHVTEGGLPIPPDKKAVPQITFARMLKAALQPPDELARIPYAKEAAACRFVSLLLKPVVQPQVPNIVPDRYMEIRFFAPGNLVSNLDFVESIFGNAGDPYLPHNDSALDPEHWTGHTGCVILATHLTTLRKKDLGLPHLADATDRQKRDGMCWEKEDELYNEGTPFKITARDERGVIVTLIADNYFGYSKKEVKTQISYAANLFGMTEEEHAGGALSFPCYKLGTKFVADSNLNADGHTFADLSHILGDDISILTEGYGVDRKYPQIVYIPENAEISLEEQTVTWQHSVGKTRSIRLLPGKHYVHPTGYKINMERHPVANAWYLTGTVAEGTLCHKPCTVSGGGKSEISKSIWDAIHFTPLIIADYEKDMDQVAEIISRDYTGRFLDPAAREPGHVSRKLLSEKRTLGSVIKLLTPSSENKPEFNAWLETIPHRIKALVFLVKRFYHKDWADNWRDKFSVDVVNGAPGNILKYMNRPIIASYLRVGLRDDGTGWTHKLRQDFMPSRKVQWEDDISASIVIPAHRLEGLNPKYTNQSVKFVTNCECRFFQRPDEAVHRGYDKQAELDLSTPPAFLSNFEPLPRARVQDILEDSIGLSEYTQPVKDLLAAVAADSQCQFFGLSSAPRIFEGAPSKNPRYLQTDPARLHPIDRYLADVGTRLFRKIPAGKPVYHPINAVLPGRRNNPAQSGIRPLAVYGPIHYQELPELFMDFIASLTGKSPSTTGAGSEGALTKGPFNALVATTDLNNSLLSFILTGYNGFSTAAGHIGANYRIDHDISLLMPEIWARLSPSEREPAYLIKNGYLEKLDCFEHNGKRIRAGRLGYRITRKFAIGFLGRIFDSPELVFPTDMLQPEMQGLDDYIDGINNISETQQRIAEAYIKDGSVNAAIPPLKALLHIMAHGEWNGLKETDVEFRKLFTRESVLKADWYKKRLNDFKDQELRYLESQIAYLQKQQRHTTANTSKVDYLAAISFCKKKISELHAPEWIQHNEGTLGRDSIFKQP